MAITSQRVSCQSSTDKRLSLGLSVYREVEMNYYNFSDGQPNMSLGTCLVMDPGDSFMWSISDCNNNLTAVCYQGIYVML